MSIRFEKDAAHYSLLEGRYADTPCSRSFLLGADSEETVHKTHSHYFVERTGDLFERLLTEEPSEVSSD
jgi:hypothetical protein